MIEALIDYALNETPRINNLRVDWKHNTTDLQVKGTLEALRYLLKDKATLNQLRKHLKSKLETISVRHLLIISETAENSG